MSWQQQGNGGYNPPPSGPPGGGTGGFGFPSPGIPNAGTGAYSPQPNPGQQQQQQWGYGPPGGPPPPPQGQYPPYGGPGYAPHGGQYGGGAPYGVPSGPPPPLAPRPNQYPSYPGSGGGGGGGGGGFPGVPQRRNSNSGFPGANGHNGGAFGQQAGGWAGGNTPVAPGGYYIAPQPVPSGPAHMPPADVQRYGPSAQSHQGRQQQQPFFQYSQCNGKKRALCIGINYTGQTGELRGCINDAQNVKNFLIQKYGYKADDIVMLTDDAQNPQQRPTKANIERGMHWLVAGARPNDSLFFHYSGHGGQTKDTDGDEDDGFDEVIYPVDYQEAGHIVDDDMHFAMVKPLPQGCRLTAIFDSCHSGSALDLPYIYSTEGKIKEPNLLAEAGQGLLSSGISYMRGDKKGALGGIVGIAKIALGSNQKAQKRAKETRTSSADVISWSGCKDSQTSADTTEAGQSTGAMSFAFIDALNTNQNQTFQQLLNSIRDTLRSKYSQKPQLSSSHPMDTNILFIC